MVSGNIKWQLKRSPHAKLYMSSPISEKPISGTFISLMKHGHGKLGNHIIMVPLCILMCFFLDPQVRIFKCQRINQNKTVQQLLYSSGEGMAGGHFNMTNTD